MQVMVRYRCKPDQVEANLELARAVRRELETVQADGLRFATFQLDDQVSFVAFAEFPDGRPGPHHRLESFRHYRDTLDERCDEPPVVTVLHQVEAFNFS